MFTWCCLWSTNALLDVRDRSILGDDTGYLAILFDLSSKINRKLINERGTEQLRLINGDLLRHIGELGPFSLVVSTYTLNLISKVKFVSSRWVNDPNNFRKRFWFYLISFIDEADGFFTVLIWAVYKCGCALLLIIEITRVWKRNWKLLLVRSGKLAQINCRIWNKLWKRVEV